MCPRLRMRELWDAKRDYISVTLYAIMLRAGKNVLQERSLAANPLALIKARESLIAPEGQYLDNHSCFLGAIAACMYREVRIKDLE